MQGNVEQPWENRIPQLFWRGRDSNKLRLNLIDISRNFPDLFNVSLTNFFFFKNEEEIYGPKTDHISFYKFFDVCGFLSKPFQKLLIFFFFSININ